jgi:predicted nucleic acid-binding protein
VLAVVDTGPLYAVVDADDADHSACVEVLEDASLHLVVPAMVIAEATYLVGSRMGAKVEEKFLRGLAGVEVIGPLPEDWPRIADLVKKYASFPLGGTDACVLATAERLRTDLIVTLDRRHFDAVRFKNGKAPRVLPA